MKVTHPARRWLALLATSLVLLVAACSSSTESLAPMGGDGSWPEAPVADSAAAGSMAEAAPEQFQEKGGAQGESGQMLIVNKSIRLEVPATKEAVDKIRTLAVARDGSITDMEVATDDGWIYPRGDDGRGVRGWLVVRVPASSYEAFVTDVTGLGKVLAQSESSSDVTQEHIDLSARLKNLRAQEERLREFFDAAKDVKDMLAIETELGRVRGEIESLDAQVSYLERQAAMVTVTINLVEPEPVVSPVGDSWGFREAITNGLRGAVALLNGIVPFAIATAPIWIVGLVAFFPVRAWLRRRKQGPAAAPTGEGATAT
ncbi:MAG: DUF4349 domain-containing protein [Propionibacteriaceae bacterium]|nr:DUF4349 domain-containing protein [Propionibacteriaceae bacterium]